MRVLALDAATEACSVALFTDGEVIARAVESGKSNAAKILAMVDEIMAEGQVSLSMLDGIASSIGPGAFTGVRITVAVAQGIAFGANLPVAPVNTLEALALQLPLDVGSGALACLDARMGEVYWGCYAADAAQGVTETASPKVSAPENVAVQGGFRYWGIGRGFSAHASLCQIPGVTVGAQQSRALPHAREIARLGAIRLAAGRGLDPADVKPLYLRDKVAFTEAERSARQPL
jgi:tRNA threonylcarbamoyladenosine biosynthesis protein TsaB